MNIEQIRKLVKIANENNVESIEVQSDDMVVKIKMATSHAVSEIGAPANAMQRTYEAKAYEAVSYQTAAAAADETARPFGHEIKSPMVGVYYASPAPDKEAFVQVGSHVKKGDILCIIEAMKLMNEITADKDGEIIRICAENGQVVEYAQPLFQIA